MFLTPITGIIHVLCVLAAGHLSLDSSTYTSLPVWSLRPLACHVADVYPGKKQSTRQRWMGLGFSLQQTSCVTLGCSCVAVCNLQGNGPWLLPHPGLTAIPKVRQGRGYCSTLFEGLRGGNGDFHNKVPFTAPGGNQLVSNSAARLNPDEPLGFETVTGGSSKQLNPHLSGV